MLSTAETSQTYRLMICSPCTGVRRRLRGSRDVGVYGQGRDVSWVPLGRWRSSALTSARSAPLCRMHTGRPGFKHRENKTPLHVVSLSQLPPTPSQALTALSRCRILWPVRPRRSLPAPLHTDLRSLQVRCFSAGYRTSSSLPSSASRRRTSHSKTGWPSCAPSTRWWRFRPTCSRSTTSETTRRPRLTLRRRGSRGNKTARSGAARRGLRAASWSRG